MFECLWCRRDQRERAMRRLRAMFRMRAASSRIQCSPFKEDRFKRPSEAPFLIVKLNRET